MKKTVCIMLALIFFYTMLMGYKPVSGGSNPKDNEYISAEDIDSENLQKSISGKLIRFHVIANSDSEEDQNLKLKVRDKVLEFIAPKLKDSKSIEESREIIIKNDEYIKELAQEIVKESGYSYNVSTMLSFERFPVKSYGTITLPQGKYEAYRILLGDSNGQNWWCVMFPPLCFVDITKGEVSEIETEKSMREVLNDKEYAAVNAEIETKDIVIKSKVLELIKGLKNKISYNR